MKINISIIALVFIFVVSSFAQDSNSKRLALGIYGGIQVPGNGNNYLDIGPWLGLSANIPTGLDWCIQFEYNFWKSIDSYREPDEDLFVSEFPFLVGYKWDLDKYYFQILAGPGIGSFGSTLFGGEKDFFISFNTTLKCGFNISQEMDGFLQVRKQFVYSILTIYDPWLLGIGFQVKLK